MESFCKAVVWYYGQVRKWGLIQGRVHIRAWGIIQGNMVALLNLDHCKILKISPRAYIFQRTFLRGLFLEGAYYRREICFSKLAGLIIGGNLCQNF